MPDSPPEPFGRELVEFANLEPGMRVLDLDAAVPDLPDRSCDAVLGRFACHVPPAPPAAFADVARVLKPGGVLAISVPGPSEDGGWWASYGRIVTEFTARVPDGSPAGVTREPVSWRCTVERAGLCLISETNIEVSLPLKGPSAHWRWLLAHGSRRLYDALAEPDREEFERRVLRSLVRDHPAHGTRLIAGATLYRMTAPESA